jgi:hypothetical protein
LSVPQMAAAATRISIWSGAGVGRGQSRTSVPSGPSFGEDLTTASISVAQFTCILFALVAVRRVVAVPNKTSSAGE